jgi:hypothetical protein
MQGVRTAYDTDIFKDVINRVCCLYDPLIFTTELKNNVLLDQQYDCPFHLL